MRNDNASEKVTKICHTVGLSVWWSVKSSCLVVSKGDVTSNSFCIRVDIQTMTIQ